ncbi:unnamed protein product, partial [Durusdinium trenchii]
SLMRLPVLFHAWHALLHWRRASLKNMIFIFGWWRQLICKATFAKRAAFRAWAAAIQAQRCRCLSNALGAWRVLLLTSKSNRSRLQMVLNSWAYVRDVRMAQIAAMHRFAQCCEKSL